MNQVQNKNIADINGMFRFFVTLLFTVFYALSANAQSINQFKHIKLDSDNDISIVYEICQDEVGYIWASSEEGLIKYNGQESVYYTEYFGLPQNFSSNIKIVRNDINGNLWACSDNKIARYDYESNTFKEEYISDKLGLINDVLFIDDKILLACYNGLWIKKIGTEEEARKWYKGSPVFSLNKTSSQVLVSLRNEIYASEFSLDEIDLWLSELSITRAIEINSFIYFGTRQGELFKIDPVTKNKSLLYEWDAPVNDIIFDASLNKIFIGTDGEGVFELNRDFEIENQYLNSVNDDYSLSSNGVYDLFIDNHGQLWIATYGGGVDLLTNTLSPFHSVAHIPNDKNSIINSFTRAILEDSDGNIWYGTKTGISVFYPKSNSWKHIKSFTEDGLPTIVMALEEDGEYIWVGTFGDGAYKISKRNMKYSYFGPSGAGKNKLDLNKIYSICADSEGIVWFGGIEGNVHFIRPDNSVGSVEISQVREIKESPSGEIYIVGRNGVQYIENEFVSELQELSIANEKLNYSTINCIVFDIDVLWIGTNGDGIIKYNTNSKEYEIINKSNGLSSDNIQGIIIEGNDIWASSTKGLIHFKKNEKPYDFQIYDKRDGLLSSSFNYGSYAKLESGKLAFGGTESVLLIDPEKLNDNAIIPKVVFESIEFPSEKNKDTRNTKYLMPANNQAINLKYSQDYINVKYTGINNASNSNIRYQWKMEPISNNWSTPTEKREINFANLSPGTYTFQIKALNRYKQESDVNTLNLQIASPWWFSKIAYLVYGVLLILLSLFGYRLARALIKKRNAEEQISFYNNITHELKTPISILLSKLNSNSDNEVNVKDIKNTTRRINSLFDQLLNFGKVSSQYYQNQKISKITFQKHLDLIINSFKTEIERKNLNVTLDNNWPHEFFYYKRDVLDKITYNLVSNAIKYSKQDGSINIKCSETEEGKLQISVKDDGIGIPRDQHKDILKKYYRARNVVNSQVPGTGLGLMIVKNLLDYDQGIIYFNSEEGEGTEFIVEIFNFQSKYQEVEDKVNLSESNQDDINQKSSDKQFKILVVEDNDELRIDMVEKLSAYYRIFAARNGREGFEKAKSKLPDLIITDFIMPEIDGNELCVMLQKDEDTNHIPVFMMTVLNDSGQKVESIKSGVSDYFTKPVDFPFLVAKIDSTLEYKNKLREQIIKESEISTAAKFKDEKDAEFIKDLENYIVEKVAEESLSVQDLCKYVGMSRTAFYMKLTEMIDMSPQNFIISTKMNYARKLLLEGGMTVKEVAFNVGFSNPKYFATSFKKYFGQTPSGFLKSLNPAS